MQRVIAGFTAGLTFGAGLVISGMSNPLKVQNFLDVFGNWDPSLAFVMGGAILVAFPFFRLVRRLPKPFVADDFRLPTLQQIDGRLILGSATFGAGWGLIGLCPGPALVSLSLLSPQAIVFVFCMTSGMLLARAVANLSLQKAQRQVR
ncbi:hypothetical protein PsAD2_02693 [Pseudovibrio axinellae]|uniref:YeeE/YedE family protein n=1 Tax=Pseudovibrio axinellae TaxID=989403 RepID=A0A165XR51_9HYPH|nr:YeeE/YedE family protein [Pseudovibrio axinellae]KZL17960.1 hypothetical protein PsAD2_02693 [Pseudovibrio axinellae]SER15250.1 hypothetical protein SAMN05421798_106287 [Pseudovibrio axinellae]